MSELRRLVGAGLLIIAAGVIALGGWTVVAPLSGAIVAPAFVKVDLNRKVVQHQEGGIVREIRVRDGDTVKQGQTLVVLEDVKVDSTLDLLSIQLIAERSEEHTSELQSLAYLVCRLLLEKKKKNTKQRTNS